MKLRLFIFAAVAWVCAKCSIVGQFQEQLQQWTETHQALVRRYNGFPCTGEAYFGSGKVDTLVCIEACTPTVQDVIPEDYPSDLAKRDVVGSELCEAGHNSAAFLHP